MKPTTKGIEGVPAKSKRVEVLPTTPAPPAQKSNSSEAFPAVAQGLVMKIVFG
jgi:hypothetical protein